MEKSQVIGIERATEEAAAVGLRFDKCNPKLRAREK
jgi:hypothetical protein